MYIKLLGILSALPILGVALPAYAYIGPGAGAGTIAVALGVLASIIMALFALLWYPLKRFAKKRKTARNKQIEENSQIPKDTTEPEDS